MERLSAAAARRIALAAQGFTDPVPSGRVDRRLARRLFDRVGVIQIDSVNVVVRSQELPVFARLGEHRRDLLQQMAAEGELFEYWGHMASLLPMAHYPLFGWKMAAAYGGGSWPAIVRLQRERPDFIKAVLAEVDERGPLRPSELSDGGKSKGNWWGWGEGKMALEFLFDAGVLSVRRLANFERVYDLTERIIPAATLALPVPDADDAKRTLLAMGARALGVGTIRDIADYYRLNLTRARPLFADLVEDGQLVAVEVEGWKERAYLAVDAKRPRRVAARALLSPFDSLVWERTRTERLFGFHYRIEIYTPEPKRQFGYYVLPFLLGEDLVARVDLKADRAASALLVQGSYGEPGVPAEMIAEELAEELHAMARWLGLERVVVRPRGDLAAVLAGAVAVGA